MTMARKPVQVDRDKFRAAVRKLGNEYIFLHIGRRNRVIAPAQAPQDREKYFDLKQLCPDAGRRQGRAC